MKRLLLALCIPFLWGCISNMDDAPSNVIRFDGTAYQPVYASADEIRNIAVQPAKPLKKPGKIYVYDHFLYVNETGEGIHIIDNSDSTKPKNLSFIAIPANYDVAAKGNWLYADNAADLLVFDLKDPENPKLTKRVEKAITFNQFPPYKDIYFECPDEKKGVVMRWEKVKVDQRPNCYR